jgi:hypothetical protein
MILVEDEEFMNLDSRFLHQAMPGRADETIQYLRPTQQITAGRNQGLKEFDGIAIRLPLFFQRMSHAVVFFVCVFDVATVSLFSRKQVFRSKMELR